MELAGPDPVDSASPNDICGEMMRVEACLLVLTLVLGAELTAAQDTYDNETLEVKRMFAQRALQALTKPFVGVTKNGTVQQGLFPIRATGVSTAPVVEAATLFLATLAPEQKVRTVFSVEDLEWRNWSNVDNGIFVRQGVSLKEMSLDQREAAMNLMRASLSAKGLQLSLDIMKTDQTLREINNDVLSFDEDLYFFTMMGLPSGDEPWGWQIDGHHLVINYFVLVDRDGRSVDDRAVGMAARRPPPRHQLLHSGRPGGHDAGFSRRRTGRGEDRKICGQSRPAR